VTGLYFHRLTDEAAKSFFEDTWTVASEADRIGYRYRKGRPLSFRERKQALWPGVRSVQHRGCRLSLWLDPSAGRSLSRSSCTATRVVGRRLGHDRHCDQC